MDVLLGTEGSVLDVIGGEYEFDAWHVILHSQRGVDTGLEIRYGVNMSDIEAETDSSELVTAVVPYWAGSVNDVETVVVGDLCASDNASAFAYVRSIPLDVSSEIETENDTAPTKTQVTAIGRAFIDKTDLKDVSMSTMVKYMPINSIIGDRPINLCDTVTVVHPDLKVSSTAKVVETRFNVLTEQYDEITIGTIKQSIVDTIAKIIKKG
jgi:phage minor structural protein